ADASEQGLWIYGAGPVTFGAALDRVADSVGAWWGPDRAGVHRIARWTLPSGSNVAEFPRDASLDGRLVRAEGIIPAWVVTVLHGSRRDLSPYRVQDNPVTTALDRGDVVLMTHPRYGLSAGKQFRVLGIVPDATRRRRTLLLWG